MGFGIKDILHDKARHLLHLETDPGLGCTEPAAIGLCAATAAALLPGRTVEALSVSTDPNIYKNAMGVTIPNSGGEAGIPLAAAMGAAAGDPARRLEVFAAVDADGLARARELVRQGKVRASIAEGTQGLYVRVEATSGDDTAVAVIAGRHDHVVSRSLNGAEQPCGAQAGAGTDEGDGGLEELEQWLLGLSLGEIVDLLDDMDASDIRYVREGLALNTALCEYGLAHGPGIAVGRNTLGLLRRGLLRKDAAAWAIIRTAAGIDSRMGGAPLPAMTLAGSGNQCIAAGIPVLAAAEFATLEDEDIVPRAVMLSYLTTCAVKAGVGRLSALCGSGVAGGAGVAAAVAYLFGGTPEAVGGAVKNHIASFAPVCCDGAKTGCALKVGHLAGSAVTNGLLALSGCVVRPTDGIVDFSPEQTMRNLARVAREGIAGLDPVILGIMLAKDAPRA